MARLRQAIPGILIFGLCIAIYLANQGYLPGGDSIPNSLIAFNWLENHSFHFDQFRTSYLNQQFGTPPYFFAPGKDGHLYSIYTIGPAILTFPFYLLFYLYLKLQNLPIAIHTADFEATRVFFEKLAATLTTATSVVIFYYANRLKFNRFISFISTFIFAFATESWVVSSQLLWQHGPLNLAVCCLLFCLLKANRSSANSLKLWLLLGGIFCGLLPGIRPTGLAISVAAIVYVVFQFRQQAWPFFLGLPSALISLFWNFFCFGSFLGAYSAHTDLYQFSLKNFLEAGLGGLVSPGRGLLIYSPILLYAIPGTWLIYQARSHRDEQLLLCLNIASLTILISYCFFKVWWGGYSYGPRFFTDTLVSFCYSISYALETITSGSKRQSSQWIFIVALIYSTYIQLIGAFGLTGHNWNGIPLYIDRHIDRLWQWQDNPIARHSNSVFYRLFKPPVKEQPYLKGMNGVIEQILDPEGKPVPPTITVTPGARQIFQVKLKNTGTSPWYGYQSALETGEARVRVALMNEQEQILVGNELFVEGNRIQPNQTVYGLGEILFPKTPGTYLLVLDLIAHQIIPFPIEGQRRIYGINVIVAPPES